MSEENIRRILKKFKGRVSAKHITPHSLRHSAAMNWLENGMELFRLSILLGHEDTKTSQRYLRSTFKMKLEALEAAGQGRKLSNIFETHFESEDEFWENLDLKSFSRR